eukprot:290061_1
MTNVMDEKSLLAKYGYIKDKILHKTLQGEIFKAKSINNEHNQHRFVTIKKTSKHLHKKRESVDDNGFKYIVDENIIKEALILRHLTIENKPIGDTIIKYINFFHSNTDYYLVTEYIDGDMTLKDFIPKLHQYIKQNKLKLKEYQKIIKYLLWQLVATIHWMHNDV